jgi:GT2 family glycosyltransferase|tara:strand:- start:729 stop:1505 length:777 start_codon:yes stop_codon:yes gene_type:complete
MNKKGLYIVVCYNNEKEVITFIKDVLHNQKIDFDIYVIVNSFLNKDAFISLNKTTFLYPEKNLGYLGALNYASEKINFQKYSFVCFSNTDLTFDSPQLLSNLFLKLVDDTIGVISASIINGKRNQNPLSLKRPSKMKVFLVYLLTYFPIIYLLKQKLIKPSNFKHQLTLEDYDCYALHGSFFMFSVKHILKFNFIHNQLLYGEEIYIAEQCRIFNLRLVWSDTDIIYHNENSTTSLLGLKNRLRYIRQAKIYILKKYY